MATEDMKVYRLLTARKDLTYHVAGCRYLRNRMDRAIEVPIEEVNAAIERGRFARAEFEGQTVALNVCLQCWPYRNGNPWPEDGTHAVRSTSPRSDVPSSEDEGREEHLPPRVPNPPAHDRGAPYVGRQVRIMQGDEVLATTMVLSHPGETPSHAAMDALTELSFEVDELEPRVQYAGRFTGGELAAELVARSLVHQANAHRKEQR